MATATRIRGPLDSLRTFIRAYVTLEGMATALLFLAAWFWIGLALDWGLFKVLGQDLVQIDNARIFRIVVLMGVCGGLLAVLATMILLRLFVQFSDVAIALVLERQFPKLLGDRLITAVELNDPVAAAKFGFSEDMVRQTINEAADAVDKVPVKEAFDWRRIINRVAAFAVIMVGLYVLSVGAFAAARKVTNNGAPTEAISDVNEVSGMFVERNVMLRNTIWPRRSYLEVLSHAVDERIPRKSRPDRLLVRAWKYVIADTESPEGWRQMTWDDVKAMGVEAADLPADWTESPAVDEAESRLLAFPVRAGESGGWEMPGEGEDAEPRPLLWKELTKERLGGLTPPGIPGAWADAPGVVKAEETTLTADEVAARLEAGKGLDAKTAADMRMVFARLRRLDDVRQTLTRLDAKLEPRTMRRTARRLVIPTEVMLSSWTRTSSTTALLTRESGDNLFSAPWADVDETTSYRVSGEDYVTRTHSFTCVDRPVISEILSTEERPAYLYYRPGRDGASPTALELSGKFQKFQPLSISASGEATAHEVPIGTKLTLELTCTKPLTRAGAFFDPKERPPVGDQSSEWKPNDNVSKFKIELPAVRNTLTITFRFEDTDGVKGERRVILNPRQDKSPSVRDFAPDDVIRRDKGQFMVSAKARIPFRGRVRDEEGLGGLRYLCVVTPSDFLGEQKSKSIEGVGAVPLALSGPGAFFHAVPYLIKVQKEAEAAGGPTRTRNEVELPGFLAAVLAHRQKDDPANPTPDLERQEYLTPAKVADRMANPQKDPYRRLFNDFVLTPDPWMLDDPSVSPWGTRRNIRSGKDEPYLQLASSWLKAEDPQDDPKLSARLRGDLGLWKLKWKNEKGEESGLLERDSDKLQKRFLVEVTLVADDTHLEGERAGNVPVPNRTPSSETFTFSVVPENELLTEIGKEEEVKYRDMARAFKPLPENRDRIRDIVFELSGDVSKVAMNNMVARCEQLDEVLKQSQGESKAVYEAYERIVKEMRLNQLREDVLGKVLHIHRPLGELEALYGKTNASIADFSKQLRDADSNRERREASAKQVLANMQELVTKMNAILLLMEGLQDLYKLIAELARIEREEEASETLLKRLRDKLIRDLLGGIDPKKDTKGPKK